MRTLVQPPPAGHSPVLLALLSGAFSQPEDFVREGFDAAARANGIGAELAMAGIRAAWVADGSVVQRLHDSVIEPARARGCSRVWILGISLGALASLTYASRHGGVEGLVLLSPYPATREVLREIDEAGGEAAWSPSIPPEGDLEREAWTWLARAHPSPEVHCYYGSEDRFAEGQRRMARTLPRERVRELPGGHDWSAWRRFWDAFLADCAPALQ